MKLLNRFYLLCAATILIIVLQSLAAASAVKPYSLAENKGRMFLLSPGGKPFMILGLSHVGEALAKDGDPNTQQISKIEKQLRAWHFNTVPHPEMWKQFPFIVASDRMVGQAGLPANDPGSRFEDVFDPAFKMRLRKRVAMLCGKTHNNQNCIGYWWSDLPPWDLEFARKKFGKHWVDFIRDLPDSASGKQRYTKFLSDPGPHDDHTFLRLIARELYSETASAYHNCNPRRLLFGERYSGLKPPTEVLEEAAKFVDVISVQPYESTFSADQFDAIHRLTKKPILISDWNLSFQTKEYPITMWPSFPTQTAAAEAYEKYLRAAFSKAYILGYFKCQYVDKVQPSGLLKQGLIRGDGRIYEKFPSLIQHTHEQLIQQFVTEGRMSR
jgi:hypothetical protein